MWDNYCFIGPFKPRVFFWIRTICRRCYAKPRLSGLSGLYVYLQPRVKVLVQSPSPQFPKIVKYNKFEGTLGCHLNFMGHVVNHVQGEDH